MQASLGVRVTSDLNRIIDMMEDVAEMRVEDLAIPQTSRVTEVARIGSAFRPGTLIAFVSISPPPPFILSPPLGVMGGW